MFFKRKNQKRSYWLIHTSEDGTVLARFGVELADRELGELSMYYQYLRAKNKSQGVWSIRRNLSE